MLDTVINTPAGTLLSYIRGPCFLTLLIQASASVPYRKEQVASSACIPVLLIVSFLALAWLLNPLGNKSADRFSITHTLSLSFSIFPVK